MSGRTEYGSHSVPVARAWHWISNSMVLLGHSMGEWHSGGCLYILSVQGISLDSSVRHLIGTDLQWVKVPSDKCCCSR